MKQNITILLVACVMFLTFFVGCQQKAATPTDIVDEIVSATEPVDVELSEDTDGPSLENSTEDNEDVAPSKDVSEEKNESVQITNSSKENKSNSSKVVASQPITESNQDENSNSSYLGDAVIEHPTFTTEKELKNWFLGKGSASYDKDLTQALSTLSNSKTAYYYRPISALETKQFSLDSIVVNSSTGMFTYTYALKNSEAELVVFACNLPDTTNERVYKSVKNDCAFKVENTSSYTFGDITYYCDYSPKSQQMLILWYQFEKAHMAAVVGYDEPIEELIPLLKLEQVTVKLNNDHVTQ